MLAGQLIGGGASLRSEAKHTKARVATSAQGLTRHARTRQARTRAHARCFELHWRHPPRSAAPARPLGLVALQTSELCARRGRARPLAACPRAATAPRRARGHSATPGAAAWRQPRWLCDRQLFWTAAPQPPPRDRRTPPNAAPCRHPARATQRQRQRRAGAGAFYARKPQGGGARTELLAATSAPEASSISVRLACPSRAAQMRAVQAPCVPRNAWEVARESAPEVLPTAQPPPHNTVTRRARHARWTLRLGLRRETERRRAPRQACSENGW